MKAEKIIVWNASKGALRIGENKALLKPAQKMTVSEDAAITALIAAGKLVVVKKVEVEVAETIDAPAEQPKKKKKEVVKEQAEVASEEEEKKEEQSTIESIETSEDSILAEEAF